MWTSLGILCIAATVFAVALVRSDEPLDEDDATAAAHVFPVIPLM